MIANIDSQLGHCRNGMVGRLMAVQRAGAGRRDRHAGFKARRQQMFQEPLGHGAAAYIARAYHDDSIFSIRRGHPSHLMGYFVITICFVTLRLNSVNMCAPKVNARRRLRCENSLRRRSRPAPQRAFRQRRLAGKAFSSWQKRAVCQGTAISIQSWPSSALGSIRNWSVFQCKFFLAP